MAAELTHVARDLRRARDAAGLTRRQLVERLAERCDVHVSVETLRGWERHNGEDVGDPMPVERAQDVARALGLHPLWFERAYQADARLDLRVSDATHSMTFVAAESLLMPPNEWAAIRTRAEDNPKAVELAKRLQADRERERD